MTIANKSALKAALSAASKAVKNSSVLPVLRMVLIQAAGDQMRITGTDLEVTVSCTIAALTDEGCGWALCAPVQSLTDLVGASEGGEVEISPDGDRLALKAGKALSHLKTLPAAEFPQSKNAEIALGSVSAEHLSRYLARVLPAVSTADRPGLGNVQLFIGAVSKPSYMVATDGFRLVRQQLEEALTAPDGVESLLIPRRSAATLSALLPTSTGLEVAIDLAEGFSNLAFCWQGTSVSINLSGEKFPDWSRFFESGESAYNVILPRAAVLNAVGLVQVFAEGPSPTALLTGSDSDSAPAIVVAGQGEKGTSKTEVPCESNFPRAIRYNPAYLGQALQAFDGENLPMRFGDGLVPTFFENGKDLAYLLMPMAS